MHLFKTLKYRREVGDGILNRPLSLHQRPFDEQAATVSSGWTTAVHQSRDRSFKVLITNGRLQQTLAAFLFAPYRLFQNTKAIVLMTLGLAVIRLVTRKKRAE